MRSALCALCLVATLTKPALAQDQAWLGVTATSGPGIKYDFESKRKYTWEAGEAKVVRVDDAGPAAAAGIKLGDLILALDDQLISSGKELVAQCNRSSQDQPCASGSDGKMVIWS